VIVASWNIQKGIGTDFRKRLERTAHILATMNADVIGLQEVLRTPSSDQAIELANALDMTLVWGPARDVRGGGTFGNALLVRGDVIQSSVHDISVPHCEKRACLEVAVRVGEDVVRVFVCHFGLGPRERARQITRVMEITASCEEPRIVLGDFNEWQRRGPVTRTFETEFPSAAPPKRTHPSPLPLFALDRIVWDDDFTGDTAVQAVAGASDHRLLRAELARA
jgi:endonuclease/exonuclease/phosphatase family metal-dependent hydrolase